MSRPSPFHLYLSLAMVSAAALGFELLLMRYFALSYGSHFASSIISMALLGIGTAGSVLQILRNTLLPRFHRLFPSAAALLGLSMVSVIIMVRQVPFNPGELTWAQSQWLFLVLNYLLFALPFFFSGFCTAIALASGEFPPGKLYRADLLGACAGGLGVLAALSLLPPEEVLRLLAMLSLAAAAVAGFYFRTSRRSKQLTAGTLLAAVFLLFLPSQLLRPLLSDYKDLARLGHLPGTRIMTGTDSPLGRIDIAESPESPVRSAPGLSPLCPHPVPVRAGIYLDADLYGALYSPEKDTSYLDCLSAKLAFLYLKEPRVFIKNIFASAELMELALVEKASSVSGSYEHFSLPELAQQIRPGTGQEEHGWDAVLLEQGLARTVLSRPKRGATAEYDLITFWLSGSGAASLGHSAIDEQFDLTVESLGLMLSRLSRTGILMISKWRHRPPYETLKFIAALDAAVPEEQIGRNLLVISAPSTYTLLYRKSPWSRKDITTALDFCSSRGFMLEYPAGPDNPAEAQSLAAQVDQITGPEAADFRKRYKFYLEAPTDNRPFFGRFFRWSSAPELLKLRRAGGSALLQWGYLTKAATLVLAVLAGAVLILLPLLLRHREAAFRGMRSRVILYFSALGLAFLFVELMLIHLFTLFLGHPFLSAGVVMVAFLLWAGIGSGLSRHFSPHKALFCIGIVLGSYLLGLPPLLRALAFLSAPSRLALTLVLCFPPAFFMGMPFPQGIERLQSVLPAAVPWAWAINGVASVASPLLAAVLAIHMGFGFVLAGAILLYIGAFLSAPGNV